MLQLVMLMLLAAQDPGGTLRPGEGSLILRERIRATTATTNIFLLTPRPPDCRNAEEEQIAIEQVRNGELGQCMVRDQSRIRER